MEFPSAPNTAQLEQILILIATGQELQAASKFLKRYMKSSISVEELLTNLLGSQHANVRQLASVLLRKNIMKHWKSLEAKATEIKQALLFRLTAEPEALVRRNLASLIARMSETLLSSWPELLELISALCVDSRPIAREVGLYLLSEILENEQTCELLKPNFGSLGALLMQSLTDGGSFEIQKNALIAIGNLIYNAADSIGDLNPIIPLVLSVVSSSVDNGDEELVAYAFDIFDNLLDDNFKLSSHWETIIRLGMSKVGLNSNLQLSTRESASDFIESVAEDHPATFTKNLPLLSWVLESIFTIASECDDDPDETTQIDMAFRLLKTLALSLPNKYIFQPVVALVSSLRHNSNERVRRAAVMAIGLIAEGCSASLRPQIQGILDTIIPAFQDESLAVKEGAAIALGYCSEHLQPDILDFHEIIIPALLQSLDTPKNFVRNRVLFAIDTFIAGCDEELEPYLQSIMTKLVEVVIHVPENHSKHMALSALNTVINSAEKRTTPYFTDLVGLLFKLTQSEDDRGLVAISLHTLGQLAANCGREMFEPYFATSANLALQFIQTEDLELREAGFAFFYLVSRIYKETMEPYLSVIITEAFKSIEKKQIIQIEEDSDSEDDEEGEDGGYTSNTLELDEKTAAMHTLGHIALGCPQAMPLFVERLLEDLEFQWNHLHESIRLQVVTTYIQIVQALSSDPKTLSRESALVWFDKALPKYLHLMTEDESDKVVNRVLENVEDLLEQKGPQILPKNWLDQITVKTLIILSETAACQRSLEDDEFDSNEELMSNLVAYMDGLVGAFREDFQTYFNEIVTAVLELLKPSKTERIRTVFTGFIAESFNKVPALIPHWATTMLEVAFVNFASGESALHRNTCFLVGIICEAVKEDAAPYYGRILSALQPFFTGDNELALVDNAVAAVSRMLPVCLKHFPVDQVLTLWFSKLPIKDDFDEVKTVLRGIVYLSQNYDVTGFAERIVEVLFDAILTHTIEPDKYKIPEDVWQAVVALTATYRTHPAFQAVGSRLSGEQQGVLSKILT
mmetsp:Transcript_34463/g.60479  ORF Transcript_34463/g.60479 Transcript_34463/m.60479 type:complete len:1030 (+) Transcript_34463:1481-4570(+)